VKVESARLQVKVFAVPDQANVPPEAGVRSPASKVSLSFVAPEVLGATVAYKKLGVCTVSTREVETMLNSPAVYGEPTTASPGDHGVEDCKKSLV